MMIKQRRMRQAGHVAHTGDRISACSVLVGQLKGKGTLKRNLSVDWRIILKCILKK
jgi:hypothetical protein